MGWKWVVYHKVGFTVSGYMDRCTAVELEWLLDTDHFYPANLPKDYNGRVRNKKIREIFDKLGHPDQPTGQHP
ncbi:uncharacterized protein BKA55DRAFT_578615 [Fusarium redolens]|uniref:Uncharacterized protein n=1 Tax=Fusarium redolens TaxID=48865 RepID=A0A9P9K1H2_FUSRE|nr:uncharacterized protein BKA55DRAFT_578615 [Fusarium redolens]KAH7236834.1 hypothetical protein BKA55DRAFT_578615 [Fusarium redolens]